MKVKREYQAYQEPDLPTGGTNTMVHNRRQRKRNQNERSTYSLSTYVPMGPLLHQPDIWGLTKGMLYKHKYFISKNHTLLSTTKCRVGADREECMKILVQCRYIHVAWPHGGARSIRRHPLNFVY